MQPVGTANATPRGCGRCRKNYCIAVRAACSNAKGSQSCLSTITEAVVDPILVFEADAILAVGRIMARAPTCLAYFDRFRRVDMNIQVVSLFGVPANTAILHRFSQLSFLPAPDELYGCRATVPCAAARETGTFGPRRAAYVITRAGRPRFPANLVEFSTLPCQTPPNQPQCRRGPIRATPRCGG